jgi:hypothetical protein
MTGSTVARPDSASWGYRYESIDGYGIAIFTAIRFGKRYAIPAATVMNADDIVWSDTLERAERFFA